MLRLPHVYDDFVLLTTLSEAPRQYNGNICHNTLPHWSPLIVLTGQTGKHVTFKTCSVNTHVRLFKSSFGQPISCFQLAIQTTAIDW